MANPRDSLASTALYFILVTLTPILTTTAVPVGGKFEGRPIRRVRFNDSEFDSSRSTADESGDVSVVAVKIRNL